MSIKKTVSIIAAVSLLLSIVSCDKCGCFIGQRESMYAEILVMDFDMVKDGIYRLTFGDAVIDFELQWKMIW